MKLFEKLQSLISTSEADKYEDICEIFDLFVERGLYVYYEEAFCDTHSFLSSWIRDSEKDPKHVLDLVKYVFQIVIDEEEKKKDEFNDLHSLLGLTSGHEVGSDENDELSSFVNKLVQESNLTENKHLRSWLVIVTMVSLSQIPNLKIEGTWENVIYELLKYIKTWDMDEEFSLYSLTSRTVRTLRDDFSWQGWFDIACSTKRCPNPYLRLEILWLILLFDPDETFCDKYKKEIIVAYGVCMSSIDSDRLFVIKGDDILSMRRLMVYICRISWPSTLKNYISCKVVEELDLNQMGKEVRFLANSLKVLGLFAQIVKRRYKNKGNLLRNCLNLCMSLFMFGHKNNFSKHYNHKLLLPYTLRTIADITDGILTLSATLNKDESAWLEDDEFHRIKTKRMSLYNRIVKRRNDLVKDLDLPKEQLFHVKLFQREQSSHTFSNILLVKQTALAFTKIELGTINSDDIEPVSTYHNEEDDDSLADSDDFSSDESGEDFPLDSDDSYTDVDNNSHTDSDDESNVESENGSGSSFDDGPLYSHRSPYDDV